MNEIISQRVTGSVNLDQDQGHWPSENILFLVYPFKMSLVDLYRISSGREKMDYNPIHDCVP